MMRNKTAVIFGGNGFIGKILVRALAQKDYTVIVATRHVAGAYDLKPCGRVGQIVPLSCDYSEEVVRSIIPENVDLVVNLVGILFERKKGDFERAHVTIPKIIAQTCKEKNAARLIQISALGIEKNKSRYATTKLRGEKAVSEAYPQATFIRPSVVFGPEDDFFNRFAALASIAPFMPLIGGGKTRFQPVYVKDVVDTIVKASENADSKSAVIEAVGPEVIDLKGIYQKIFKYTKRPRPMVYLPYAIAAINAFFLEFLPNPLLTRDQLKSLKSDNIASGNYKTMADFGVVPTSMDVILPQYLCKYIQGGVFGKLGRQA